jgi:hypothetical protein
MYGSVSTEAIEASYDILDIVESLHMGSAGGEPPPPFDSAKKSSFAITTVHWLGRFGMLRAEDRPGAELFESDRLLVPPEGSVLASVCKLIFGRLSQCSGHYWHISRS